MTTKHCFCHSTELLPKHVAQALNSVLLKFQTKQPTTFLTKRSAKGLANVVLYLRISLIFPRSCYYGWVCRNNIQP